MPIQQAAPQPIQGNGAVPAYLERYIKAEKDYMEDFGDVEASDWGLNFLKIIQSGERHSKPGWGPTQQEAALPIGQYILDKLNALVPFGTPFVPLLRSVTYIKFKGKKPGEGIEFITKDKNDPRIKACNGLDFKENPTTGEKLAPEVTKYVNFYVITPYNLNEPAVLSFHRTATKVGAQLTKQIAQATAVSGKLSKLPMFTLKFTLMQPRIIMDGSNTWFQIVYQPAGFVNDAMLAHFEKMHDMAKMMSESSFGVDEDEIKSQPSGKYSHEEIEKETQNLSSRPPQVAPQAPPQMIPQTAPIAVGTATGTVQQLASPPINPQLLNNATAIAQTQHPVFQPQPQTVAQPARDVF
jgi:hypothetical protein